MVPQNCCRVNRSRRQSNSIHLTRFFYQLQANLTPFTCGGGQRQIDYPCVVLVVERTGQDVFFKLYFHLEGGTEVISGWHRGRGGGAPHHCGRTQMRHVPLGSPVGNAWELETQDGRGHRDTANSTCWFSGRKKLALSPVNARWRWCRCQQRVPLHRNERCDPSPAMNEG